MNIKILVAAHKEFPMPADKDLYLPVLVGATKNYKTGINYQRDDEGENISLKNPNYNELTAIYWAWKNLDADAIGLVHYRRLFSRNKKRSFKNVLNKKDVEKLLEDAEIILPKKRKYYIETIYSHYIHSHHKEPLDETRRIIQQYYPEYLKSFDKLMNQRSAHMFNMFIMKKKVFNEYADWLFSVLFKLENRIDVSNYSTQEARVFGYISELLINVWLSEHNYKVRECNWVQIGKRHIFKKGFFFLKRKVVKSENSQTHF